MKHSKLNVLFFVFNRPVHTETTLSEILKQKEYIETLFIHVDYAVTQRDKLLQEKTLNTINKILKGEKINVIWHEATENKGIAKSVVGLTNHIAETETLPTVVIEDDCVPLPGFMKYMSYYLYEFKDDPEIYTICGYQYKEDPITTTLDNIPIIDVEKTNRFNPWGWGMWPHKWKFEWLNSIDNSELKKLPSSVSEFLKMKQFQTGEIDIWSTTVIFKQYVNNFKTIIPTVSLVENIGFDGTGVHSEVTNVFTKDNIIKSEPLIIKRCNTSMIINDKRENEIEIFLADNLSKVMFNKQQL